MANDEILSVTNNCNVGRSAEALPEIYVLFDQANCACPYIQAIVWGVNSLDNGWKQLQIDHRGNPDNKYEDSCYKVIPVAPRHRNKRQGEA